MAIIYTNRVSLIIILKQSTSRKKPTMAKYLQSVHKLLFTQDQQVPDPPPLISDQVPVEIAPDQLSDTPPTTKHKLRISNGEYQVDETDWDYSDDVDYDAELDGTDVEYDSDYDDGNFEVTFVLIDGKTSIQIRDQAPANLVFSGYYSLSGSWNTTRSSSTASRSSWGYHCKTEYC